MATKSSNTYGNPYHDEEGKFTSKENNGSGVKEENKVLDKMGLAPQSSFKAEKGELQRSVPQTNADGSPRIFYNNLKPEEKMAYIRKLRSTDIAKPMTDNDIDTLDIKTPERQAFREQTIENEINRQLKEGEKGYDRKATIIFGLPASGKTTLAQYLKKKDGSFEIDSDFFTEQIPEFKADPSMISAVHREAGAMSKKMMNDIAEKGGNMIIGKVGGGIDTKYLESFLDDLYKNNYEVEIVLNDIPLEEGIKRNLKRHKEGNPRLVPSMVSIVADATLFDNVAKLMNHPSVVGGSVYSNDVPFGREPKFIRTLDKEA